MLPAVLACLQQQHRSCCAKLHSCWAKALSSRYRYCLCQVYGMLNTKLQLEYTCVTLLHLYTHQVFGASDLSDTAHGHQLRAVAGVTANVQPKKWSLAGGVGGGRLPAVVWCLEGVCLTHIVWMSNAVAVSCQVAGMELHCNLPGL